MNDTVTLTAARALSAKQAEDEGLWFEARTITEAYLQNALRELATAIERPEVAVPQKPVGYTYTHRGLVSGAIDDQSLPAGIALYTKPKPPQPAAAVDGGEL